MKNMNKRNAFIAVLSFIISGSVYAQKVDYNTIILPSDVTDVSIEEKLVQLAWENYPANKEAQRVVELNEHKVKAAGSDWLSMIRLNFNLNEFNIDENNARNEFYPKYNLGVQIPLGSFVEIPQNIKVAKKNVEISRLRLNETKLNLRAEVLSRYQNYLSAKEVYKIQKEAETDTYSNFLLIEQEFKAGEVHVSAYVQASKNYNDQRVRTVMSENDYKQSIIELEELIGIKLTDLN